jgi:hypothetical protein
MNYQSRVTHQAVESSQSIGDSTDRTFNVGYSIFQDVAKAEEIAEVAFRHSGTAEYPALCRSVVQAGLRIPSSRPKGSSCADCLEPALPSFTNRSEPWRTD